MCSRVVCAVFLLGLALCPLVSVLAGSSASGHHIAISVAHTDAESQWLAMPQHSQQDKQLFLTAFRLASAVSEHIDTHYASSLPLGSSYLELLSGVPSDQGLVQVSEEFQEWADQAKLSGRSMDEIRTAHRAQLEEEVTGALGASEAQTEAQDELQGEMLAEIESSVNQWAAPLKQALQKATGTAGQEDNSLLEQQGRSESGIESMEEGAIDAGVSMGMENKPVGHFRFAQMGMDSAAAIQSAFTNAGPEAAVQTSQGALTETAKNWILSKIPPNKIIHHAMAGPLGKAVEKFGAAALETPEGKAALARSQKELATKVMKTPMARVLIDKVKGKAEELKKTGESKALLHVSKHLQPKGGLATPMPVLSSPEGLKLIKEHAMKAAKEVGKQSKDADFLNAMRADAGLPPDPLAGQPREKRAEKKRKDKEARKGKGKGGKGAKGGKGKGAGKHGKGGKGKGRGKGKGKGKGKGRGKGKGKARNGKKGGKGKHAGKGKGKGKGKGHGKGKGKGKGKGHAKGKGKGKGQKGKGRGKGQGKGKGKGGNRKGQGKGKGKGHGKGQLKGKGRARGKSSGKGDKKPAGKNRRRS